MQLPMAPDTDPRMMPPEPGPPDPILPAGESLAERVQRDGPLRAGPVWELAQRLLDMLAPLHAQGLAYGSFGPADIRFPDDGSPTLPPSVAIDPAAGTDATREDLRQLGATLWFALTGEPFDTPSDQPFPWQKLDAAGITPALGALPVLLARTLTGDPTQRPPTAQALLETLNVLASLASPVPSSPPMPSRAPSPEPVAPTPEVHPLAAEEGDLWTRPASRLTTPNRRRRKPGPFLRGLLLVLCGLVPGFFGGIAYEKNHAFLEATWGRWLSSMTPSSAATVSPTPGAPPAAEVDPGVPLPPSLPVSTAGVAARLDRIKTLQPDVRDVLKYARELRRVATLPVADADTFPTEAQVRRLVERFDWTDPASPNAHGTPLLLVLGCAPEPPDAPGQTASQSNADRMAQALAQHGITAPIYTCGLGNQNDLPEIEPVGEKNGPFVEVWVAFTLF